MKKWLIVVCSIKDRMIFKHIYWGLGQFSVIIWYLFLRSHFVLVQHTQLLKQEDDGQSVVSLFLSVAFKNRTHYKNTTEGTTLD